MLRIEDQCVDCGLPCLGNSCAYQNIKIFCCDQCGREDASYRIDGEDYCEKCAKDYIKNIFDEFSLSEQAEILNVNMQKIEDIWDK